MNDTTIATNKYGKYCLPNSSLHRPASKLVQNGQVHEPETLKFIRDHCEGTSVIHAGAYFGDFIPAIAEVADKLLAFEPSDENYSCALETIRLNGLSNVVLLNKAIGNEESVVKLQTHTGDGTSMGGTSRINKNQDGNGKYEEVELTTITKECELHLTDSTVSVIQLDVEGFELPALQGAIDIIDRYKPWIIIEIWEPDYTNNDAYKLLNNMGYEFDGTLHDNIIMKYTG